MVDIHYSKPNYNDLIVFLKVKLLCILVSWTRTLVDKRKCFGKCPCFYQHGLPFELRPHVSIIIHNFKKLIRVEILLKK